MEKEKKNLNWDASCTKQHLCRAHVMPGYRRSLELSAARLGALLVEEAWDNRDMDD